VIVSENHEHTKAVGAKEYCGLTRTLRLPLIRNLQLPNAGAVNVRHVV
jgi:hypothetical protein